MSDILLVGLNHRTAEVEIREGLALNCTVENFPFKLSENIKEILVLSTCNRVEILAVGSEPELMQEEILSGWAALCNKNVQNIKPYLYIHHNKEAIKHVFSVASSLDSMVLGEPQILGQLKDAYRMAVQVDTARLILNKVLHKSFFVAKKVRTQTNVASSAVSVSYAAVELAKRIFGDMSQYRAMLIGAGDMAELSATHLMQAGIKSMKVCNRTFSRARELADRFLGEPVAFENMLSSLVDVDIVISSTGAVEPVIMAEDVRQILKKRRQRPMFFIDIAVPRDIDPHINDLDNVYLYDIDDLNETVAHNLSNRLSEADKAREIVEAECLDFCEWLNSLKLQPTIVALIDRHQNYAEQELAKTLKKINLDSQQLEAVQTMLNSLVRKINHQPIEFLKNNHHSDSETDSQSVDLIRRIFKLN